MGVYHSTGPTVLNNILSAKAVIHTQDRKYVCIQGTFTNEHFQYIDKPRGKWTHINPEDLVKNNAAPYALYAFTHFSRTVLLYGLYRHKQGKPNVGKRWKEHFGITPPLKTTTPPIWIHAASVGETLAVTPLIKQIKQRSPNTPILLTTTTPTGAEQAEKLADWVEHRYTPIDFRLQ